MTAKNRNLILLAPVIFVCHFLEEAPGFVAWFNAHVSRGITQNLFWSVNGTALLITLAVAAAEWKAPSPTTAGLAVAWLSFLMLANAAFHIGGSVIDGSYTPGVVTAVCLYLPYALSVFARMLRDRRLSIPVLAILALAGSVPMLIHGYRILFLGSRLF